jgi:hypothetical protein
MLKPWMPVARLELHDVRDAHALVVAIVQRSGLRLLWHDREDLEQFLLVELWRLSASYDPSHGIAFSTFATPTIRRRVTDWRRTTFGRTKWSWGDGTVYERERPQLLSVDTTAGRVAADALAARRGDPAANWLEDGGGFQRERDRARARDLEALGLPAP